MRLLILSNTQTIGSFIWNNAQAIGSLATVLAFFATIHNSRQQEKRFNEQLQLQKEQWLNDAYIKIEAETWVKLQTYLFDVRQDFKSFMDSFLEDGYIEDDNILKYLKTLIKNTTSLVNSGLYLQGYLGELKNIYNEVNERTCEMNEIYNRCHSFLTLLPVSNYIETSSEEYGGKVHQILRFNDENLKKQILSILKNNENINDEEFKNYIDQKYFSKFEQLIKLIGEKTTYHKK
jgi:hypothetical protein